LSEGEIKNFGKPIDLLMDETSVLYELTKKLSSSERKTLIDIATKNSAKTNTKADDNSNGHVNLGADIKENE